MEASKPSGMADSARAYAARAWSVIPIQPRGKRPLVAELMRTWNRNHCRPPLSDAGVLRVVESVERMHERDSGAAA